MGRPFSAALPIAYVVLRILIVANWIFGACITALITYTFINPEWTARALDIVDYPHADTVLNGMRAVAALGLVAIPINYAILSRLVAMVVTVRCGDPFVPANAERLQAIAWLILALQIIGIAIWAIAEMISTPAHPVDLDAGTSVNGWLAVLLTFVLARVFAEGTMMREDLDGTI